MALPGTTRGPLTLYPSSHYEKPVAQGSDADAGTRERLTHCRGNRCGPGGVAVDAERIRTHRHPLPGDRYQHPFRHQRHRALRRATTRPPAHTSAR